MKKLVLVFGIVFILCLSLISANWFGDIFYGKKNVAMSPEIQSQVQSCLENVCSDFGPVRKQACLNSNLRRVQCERESERKLGVRENSESNNFICIDFDGENFFEKGIVIWNGLINTDVCSTENNALVEYTCDNGFIVEKEKDCSEELKICRNGACVDADCPSDSTCHTEWPTREGEFIDWHADGQRGDYTCDRFEVCSDKMDWVIEDAKNCCEIDNFLFSDEKKERACTFARENDLEIEKRCKALYWIRSLGVEGAYIKGYFNANICCNADKENQMCYKRGEYNYLGTCNIINGNFGENVLNMPCVNADYEHNWISNIDMGKNDCQMYAGPRPAHVALNILETGACSEYSILITTILRRMGYSVDEVITVRGKDISHTWNLVRFPGERYYYLVDTTGNKPDNIFCIPGITCNWNEYYYDEFCVGDLEYYNDLGYLGDEEGGFTTGNEIFYFTKKDVWYCNGESPDGELKPRNTLSSREIPKIESDYEIYFTSKKTQGKQSFFSSVRNLFKNRN